MLNVQFVSSKNIMSATDFLKANECKYAYYHESYGEIKFYIDGKKFKFDENLNTVWYAIPNKESRFIIYLPTRGFMFIRRVKRLGNKLYDERGELIMTKQTFCQGKFTKLLMLDDKGKRYNETRQNKTTLLNEMDEVLRLTYTETSKINFNPPKEHKKTRKQFWSLVVKCGHETGIKYDEIASIAYEKILNTSYDDFMNFGKVRNGKEKVIDVVDRLVDGDFTDLYNVLVNEFKF